MPSSEKQGWKGRTLNRARASSPDRSLYGQAIMADRAVAYEIASGLLAEGSERSSDVSVLVSAATEAVGSEARGGETHGRTPSS